MLMAATLEWRLSGDLYPDLWDVVGRRGEVGKDSNKVAEEAREP